MIKSSDRCNLDQSMRGNVLCFEKRPSESFHRILASKMFSWTAHFGLPLVRWKFSSGVLLIFWLVFDQVKELVLWFCFLNLFTTGLLTWTNSDYSVYRFVDMWTCDWMKFRNWKPHQKNRDELHTYMYVCYQPYNMNFEIYVTISICMILMYSCNNENMNIKYMTSYFLKSYRKLIFILKLLVSKHFPMNFLLFWSNLGQFRPKI